MPSRGSYADLGAVTWRLDVLLAWLASGVTVALVGVGQWIAGEIVPAGGVGRVTGVYFSPNHLALYLERIWPLGLTLALYGGLHSRWRSIAWPGVVLLSVALYLTYSRAAWVLAIPVVLIVIGISYRRRLRGWMVGMAALTALLAVAGVLLGRSTASFVPLHSELMREVRIPVWQSTLEMIADRPWMGVGLDGFRLLYPRYMRISAWAEPLLYHPHNVWLDAAVRLGVPGLVVFFFLAGEGMREAYRAVGRAHLPRTLDGRQNVALWRAVAVGCLASLCAGLAHGWVDSGYFVVDLAWSLALVSGMVVGFFQSPYTCQARLELGVGAD
jgi:putative inorganic carbon (HCO3(-)) transporter